MKTDQTESEDGKEQSLQRAWGAAGLQGGPDALAPQQLVDNPPIGDSVIALLTNKPGVILVLKRLRENQVPPRSDNELPPDSRLPQALQRPSVCYRSVTFDDRRPIKNAQQWPLKSRVCR